MFIGKNGTINKLHVFSHYSKFTVYSPCKKCSCNIQKQSFPNTLLCTITKYHRSSEYCGDIIPFKLSDIGEGIAEVVLKEWYVKVGDKVNQFDSICEVQSDKASVTITSRFDGLLRRLYHNVDDIVKVGMPLVDIELEEQISDKSPQLEEYTPKPKILCSPAVRKFALDNKVDLSEVEPTGKNGQVLKDDIIRHFRNGSKIKISHVDSEVPYTPISISQAEASTTLIKDDVEIIKGIQKVMVKTMTKSLKIPHFVYCDEINVGNLVDLRLKSKKYLPDTSVTFLPFLLKAASLALIQFPKLNAHVDVECETMTIRKTHNIGVAIDTPHGLIVPNIKNVKNLSISEISEELKRLQELAIKDSLSVNDLSGGTFTLSNIGSIGGTYASPVILSPEVMIGATGKIQKLPRFDENNHVTMSHIMQVSWAADHRVTDGATVARFSNLWKSFVEYPEKMLFSFK